jgi:hypothetical protein
MDGRDVGEVEPDGGCLDPVHSTPLRIDQGERGGWIRYGQWKAGESST